MIKADIRTGIEIEVESTHWSKDNVHRWLLANTPHWQVVSDHSLRGGLLSWEARSTGRGIPIIELPAALRSISTILSENIDTWRAAVHIHVDCTALPQSQRALMYAASALVDDYIFTRVSPHRRESNFCEPVLTNLEESIRLLTTLYYCGSSNLRCNKYSSINLSRLVDLGTIEFRHMQTPSFGSTLSTVNAGIDKVIEFADLCARVGLCVRAARLADKVSSSAFLTAIDRIATDLGMHAYSVSDEVMLAIMRAMRTTTPKTRPKKRSSQSREAASRSVLADPDLVALLRESNAIEFVTTEDII